MALSLRRLIRLPCLLLLSAALLSCGGGDGGGSTGTVAPAPLSTGTFTDAPTQGLHYYAYPSGLEGYTDAEGHFQYRVGDVVAFRVQLGSGTLKLGEFMPDSIDATVSVLALRRGGLAAQLLQSMDHSIDPAYLDVSSVDLDFADFDAIAAWFASDGQTLPAGKSAQQMLADAQANAINTPAFTQPGAVNADTAVTRARDVVDTLINSTAESDAAAIVDGKVLLHTGYGNYGPVAELLVFDSAGQQATRIGMSSDGSGASTRTDGYATNLNTVSFDDGDFMQLQGTAELGLTTFTDIDGPYGSVPGRGAGNYRTLVGTALDVRNQMRTIRGYHACEYYNGTTFVFSADGQSWSAYCESASTLASGSVAAPQVVESGTVSATLPQLLKLTNSCGVVHYLGVLDGSFSNGRLALLTPATAANAVGRLDTGIVAQIGTSKASLLLPFTGSCTGAGDGTPAMTFFTGSSLGGTFTGIAGLRGRMHLKVDGELHSSVDVQLPDAAAGAPAYFHQLPESGSYEILPPPGCTVQDGTGDVQDPVAFAIDCSDFADSTAHVTQGGTTMLLGDAAFTGRIALLQDDFTLGLPPLPDSVAVRVCASVAVADYPSGTALADTDCFASGTGFAMPYNPTPQTGMPFYVVSNGTAHNHYSADRRVTTAGATTVYLQGLSYISLAISTPFRVNVLVDMNANGIIDSGELWNADVSRPAPATP
jgi:hypothetical protein